MALTYQKPKGRGAASEADVARHVVREMEKLIQEREASSEEYDDTSDKTWLAFLKKREEKLNPQTAKKRANPLKESKRG